MPWTPPPFTPGVVWEDLPSVATPVDAADLNLDENTEASYAATVGSSVVSYFEGGSSPALPSGGTADQRMTVRSDGTVAWVTPPAISARAWNILPTNSSATNSTQIALAVTQASANLGQGPGGTAAGGRIEFGSGTYKVQQAVLMKYGVKLYGVGAFGNTIFQADNTVPLSNYQNGSRTDVNGNKVPAIIRWDGGDQWAHGVHVVGIQFQTNGVPGLSAMWFESTGENSWFDDLSCSSTTAITRTITDAQTTAGSTTVTLPQQTPALLHSTAATPGSGGGTTPAIDTTGASLLVVTFGGANVTTTVTDSNSNDWTVISSGSGVYLAYSYKKGSGALVTGTNHTVSVTGTGLFPAIWFGAYSGTLTATSPLAASHSGTNSATSIQPGSITPTQANSLLVTALTTSSASGGTDAVDSGFSIINSQEFASGVNFGNWTATQVQAVPAAINPTWSHASSAGNSAIVAAFSSAPSPNSFTDDDVNAILTFGGGIDGNTTITIANPAVVSTTSAHGLSAGQGVYFSTTGVLPGGLLQGIPYYVLASGLTSTSFQIAATPGGTAIATSGNQSGTHTITAFTPIAPTVAASGSGSTVTPGTYQVAVTYVTASSETPPSAMTSVTVASGQNIVITAPPAFTGATGWFAYVSAGAAGFAALRRQQAAGSPTNIGTGLTISATPATTGASPYTKIDQIGWGVNSSAATAQSMVMREPAAATLSNVSVVVARPTAAFVFQHGTPARFGKLHGINNSGPLVWLRGWSGPAVIDQLSGDDNVGGMLRVSYAVHSADPAFITIESLKVESDTYNLNWQYSHDPVILFDRCWTVGMNVNGGTFIAGAYARDVVRLDNSWSDLSSAGGPSIQLNGVEGQNWFNPAFTNIIRDTQSGQTIPVSAYGQQATYPTIFWNRNVVFSGGGALANVVTSSQTPSVAGAVWKALSTVSNAATPVPDVAVDAHRYCKGDSTQDELANLQLAIAEVQARLGATGGAFGVIDLGYGIYKLSNTLVLPSNVGLISNGPLGHLQPSAELQPWTSFPDQVGQYLVATGDQSTTVTAGSNGVDVTTFAGAGTLNVANTTGFPTSGNVVVGTSWGTAMLSYTNTSGTAFTGVNLVNGGGLLATGVYAVTPTTNNVLSGIGVFVNNAFLHASAVQWNSTGGHVERCYFRNSAFQGFVLNGSANTVVFNFSEGGIWRSIASSTVNGAGQTFPTSTTLNVADASGFPTAGRVRVAGVIGEIVYTGISGNQLTGCTGGQGTNGNLTATATNGGSVSVAQYPTLSTFTGLGIHLAITSADNVIAFNEFGGGSGTGAQPITPQMYHCAALNDGGGPARWVSNIIESSDTGIYINAKAQYMLGNRIEWNNCNGALLAASAGYCHFVGNIYHNNGLGQKDRYAHLHNGFAPANSSRTAFASETFYRDTASASGNYNAAVAIYDFSNGAPNINYYSDLLIDSTAWTSQPWALCTQNPGNRPEIRAACPQYATFSGAPPSGTFTVGETYRQNTISSNTPVVWEAIVVGSGTLGTLAGVTASTTLNSPTVTLNAGGGASVPLGSYINITGVSFASGGGSTLGNVVIDKNGDTLTMAGLANAAVSSAATSFNGVGSRNARALTSNATVAQTTPAIATGQSATTTTAVSNAALGNQVGINYTQDLKGVQLYGYVSSAGNVSWFWVNNTGSTQTLASGNVQIWVKANNA